MSSHSRSPCAACKFLRTKCTQECIFAPYFPADQPQKFESVHRVYGKSNVAKLLHDLDPSHREDAVNSLAYEAQARLRDPIYGCVGFISILQQKLKELRSDLLNTKNELSTYIGPQAMLPILQPPILGHHHHHLTGVAYKSSVPHTTGNIVMQGGPLVSHEPQPHQTHELKYYFQQQQRMIQTQQFAEAPTTVTDHLHHQMLLNYGMKKEEEQQQELLRFESQDGFNAMGSVTGSGYNHMTMQAGPASGHTLFPSLPLGTFENPNNYHCQVEEGEHDIGYHSLHHQFEEQLFLQPETVVAEVHDSVHGQLQQVVKPRGEDKIAHPYF